MISLTKNLLKILNNNKKPLISSNKTKTFIMKKLFKTDYVIYDTFFDNVSRWASDKQIVIYASKQDAEDDICPDTNEKAISCIELSDKFKIELLKQINNN
jgi:hypothetical protein